MRPLFDAPLAIVDVETTGAHPAWDRVTEIAVVEVTGGDVASEWSTLVNPGESIPPAIQALTNGGGFVDVFRVTNPDEPGLTVWQRVRSETPTVFRRVDYVLMAGVRNGAGAACTSRVVLNTPGRAPDGSPLWPSDHYGVLADLDIFGIKCAP